MMYNLYTLTDFIFPSYVAEIDVYYAEDVKTGIFIDNVAIDTLKTLRDITFYDLSLSTILTLPFGGVHLRTSYVNSDFTQARFLYEYCAFLFLAHLTRRVM